jgi:hypothetical protein
MKMTSGTHKIHEYIGDGTAFASIYGNFKVATSDAARMGQAELNGTTKNLWRKP